MWLQENPQKSERVTWAFYHFFFAPRIRKETPYNTLFFTFFFSIPELLKDNKLARKAKTNKNK